MNTSKDQLPEPEMKTKPLRKKQTVKDKYLDLYPGSDIKKIKEFFKYDEDNGQLLRYSGKYGWRRVGTTLPDRRGYIVNFNRILYRVHDLVWLLHKGSWPTAPLVALDGNMCNLNINNLLEKGSDQETFGNYLIRYENPYWSVKVWHHPYFYKGTRRKNKYDAEMWALEQLKIYNTYAVNTLASAENNSDEIETNHPGVYVYKTKNLYSVKVKVDGKFRHYSYEKNIEDAVEAQIKGQSETDEIWKAGET